MNDLKTVRGLSGFGDSIYLLSAVQQLFKKEEIIIYTDYHSIFKGYITKDWDRSFKTTYDFSYLLRKVKKETNQWQDMLINADVNKKLKFKLNIDGIKKKKNNPELIILDIYPAFGNGNGTNGLLVPSGNEFYQYAKEQKLKYKSSFSINGELPWVDLCNLFYNAKKVICQVGWAVPLAEGFDTSCDVFFTKKAMECKDRFVNTIIPEKVFTKKTSKAIII